MIYIFLVDNGTIGIKFPYDYDLVNRIRTIPNRKWNDKNSMWTISIYQYQRLLNELKRNKYEVKKGVEEAYNKTKDIAMIEIMGSTCRIMNDLSDDAKKQIDEVCSFKVKNAYYVKKALAERDIHDYDGIVHMFRDNKFPVGLVNRVKDVCIGFYDNVEVMDKRKLPDKIEVPGGDMPLWDHQKSVVEDAIRKKQGVIFLAPGVGKTRIACEIILRLSLPALFLTHTKDLAIQTKKRLEDHLGIDVGLIGMGKKIVNDVNIGMVQTYNSILKKNPAKRTEEEKEALAFLKKVPIVVADECLPYHQKILVKYKGRTQQKCIGYIVKNQLSCKALSYNHETGEIEEKPIVNYFKIPLRKKLVEITIEDEKGDEHKIICSNDHKIFSNNHYVEAKKLDKGDDVLLITYDRKKVKCEICDKEYTSLVGHVTTHGMSTSEYRKLYPKAKFAIVAESQKQKMRRKFKGMNLEERYGQRRANAIREKLRKNYKHHANWRKGLTTKKGEKNYSEKLKKAIDKGAKTARENYRTGKRKPWNKGKGLKECPTLSHGKVHSDAIKTKSKVISDSKKGKKNPMTNPIHREKMKKTITKTWNQPHMKKEQSERIKKLWENEKYRKTQVDAHKKYYRENIKKYVAIQKVRPTKLESYLNEQIINNFNVKTKMNQWKTLTIDDKKCAREIDISFWSDEETSFVILCDGKVFHGERTVYKENTLVYDRKAAKAFTAIGYNVIRYSEDEIYSNFAINHLRDIVKKLKFDSNKERYLRCWFDNN